MRTLTPSVWRLAILWQDAVLDVVTIKKRRTRITLRTGEMITARALRDADGGGHVEVVGSFGALSANDGELIALPAGHALIAHEDVPAQTMGRLGAGDSTLFHAAMIAGAVQAVVVSALVLTPQPLFDPDAGAGVAGELRRLVITPGGTAPERGLASVAATGRPADEAEKREVERTRGAAAPRRAPSNQSLVALLEETKRALQLGSDGAELRDTLGEIARSVARAPALGAGVGGLVPKDPMTEGVGNGLIGIGESKMIQLIRERLRDRELVPAEERERLKNKPVYPVELMDVPNGDVRLDLGYDLDPVVREELARAVRLRHNAIRYCYESWGLTADANRTGRVILEMTLLPNGRVENAKASVDDRGLKAVGECVERMAGEWYLGDGLVDVPTRLAFPFVLKPQERTTKGELNFDAP